MDDKKICFSFNKLNKKVPLLIKKESSSATNKEFIKCLESHEIKLLEEKPTEAPLVIPMKENHKTSRALASLMKRRAVLLDVDDTKCDTNNQNQTDNKVQCDGDTKEKAEETLEERAAREILNAAKQSNGEELSASNLVLPVLHPDKLPLDGAQESTLDDYERIPVFEFGKAMLRGMGWVEPPPETTKNMTNTASELPVVRPKGMGLGADKMLKPKPLLITPEPNEVLEIKRNAFVRIIGGKYKDLYGQIEGFDDYAGRIIVKMAIGHNKEAFNEFLCQPVTAKEYNQYGKCINNAKYEEYKRRENGVECKREDKAKSHINNKNDRGFKQENSIKVKQEFATKVMEKSSSNDSIKYQLTISQSLRQAQEVNRTQYEKNQSYQDTSSDRDDCHIDQNISHYENQGQKMSSCGKNKKKSKVESDNEVASLSSSEDESRDKHHHHHHHRKHKKRKSKKSKKRRDRSRSSRRN